MTYTPVRARPFKSTKEAEDMYFRAKAIAEHIRGDRLTPGENAALFQGFVENVKKENRTEGREGFHGWQTEWELLAEAARAAMDGKILKDGSVQQEYKSLRRVDKTPEELNLPPED